MLSRPSRRTIAVVALTAALFAPLAVRASAATSGSVVSVAVLSPTWVRTGAQLPAGVRIQVRGALSAVTVQLRAIDGSGQVRWSSTQTRTGLAAATYDLSFPVSTRTQGLGAGAYTLQASVQAGSGAAVQRSRRLFVVDPAMPKVAVSVIVRVAGTPAIGVSGSAPPDRSGDVRTVADAQALGTLVVVHPEYHLTAAVPPYLLDEWSATVPNNSGASGSEEQSGAVRADAILSLRTAVEAGMPLLRGGYADPDMSTLTTTTPEIARQIAAGDAARANALPASPGTQPSSPATGFGALAGLVPARAAAALVSSGITYVVADPGSVSRSARATTVAAAAYRAVVRSASGRSATLTVLVADRPDSKLLSDPAQSDALAASLYARALSKQAHDPLVIEVSVGAQGAATADIAKAIGALALLPWVRFVDTPSAAALPSAGIVTLRNAPSDPTPAPGPLQNAVARARVRVDAYEAAIGSVADTATVNAQLLSESRCWADADGTWDLADRGLAFAGAADTTAWNVISKVTIDAPSVTLSGSEGRVPVSIVNDSGQPLRVVLQASSAQMRIRSERIATRLAPGENILSVPVALDNARVGKLHLSVTAAGLSLARATTTVSASYLDRIVLLGAVVLVLVVLLIFIRRRMSGARTGAGTRRRHGA
jgi:hypothetical protein